MFIKWKHLVFWVEPRRIYTPLKKRGSLSFSSLSVNHRDEVRSDTPLPRMPVKILDPMQEYLVTLGVSVLLVAGGLGRSG